MNRRYFLKALILGSGAVILIPGCSAEVSRYTVFTRSEADCLDALCEQIIPADKYGPGASYAWVVNYIDRQLSGVFSAYLEKYHSGIKSITQSSLKIYNKRFEKLNFDVQTDFVMKMESDNLPAEFWSRQKSSAFLKMAIEHTKQGFYGAPRHGGNKDYISYRIMNFDYPQVTGQNRY